MMWIVCHRPLMPLGSHFSVNEAKKVTRRQAKWAFRIRVMFALRFARTTYWIPAFARMTTGCGEGLPADFPVLRRDTGSPLARYSHVPPVTRQPRTPNFRPTGMCPERERLS